MSKISDKAYYQRNKEKRKEASRLWKKNNPDKVKAHRKNSYISSKKWKEDNRDKMVGYRKRYYKKLTPEQRKKWMLNRLYGLSVEQFMEMLSNQGGVCGICGGVTLNKSLSVDHNHTTGQVRGLLCHRCNTAIGLLNEDVEIMYKVIKYLDHYNGR